MTSIRPMIPPAITRSAPGPLLPFGTASARNIGTPTPAASTAGLTEPPPRQVVRRRDDDGGAILFAGTYAGRVDNFFGPLRQPPGGFDDLSQANAV